MTTTSNVTSERLLTRVQVAEALGIQPQTLAVWASTRRHSLPFVKVGRSVRYRPSDVQAWLESRRVGNVESATS